MLNDALENDPASGHGYMPYYIEDGVRLLMTPYTDEQRYGLTAELTKNGRFEHNWNNANNTQQRTMVTTGFKQSFPGFVKTRDLSKTLTLSQDGKTLHFALPLLEEQWPMKTLEATARFGENDIVSVKVEIDPATCGSSGCSATLESPMQLPEFDAENLDVVAGFSHLSGNTSLKWRAHFEKQTADQTDTIQISDKSLF